MDHQRSLIDARARLKALPQSDDVRCVLHMVEINISVMYGRSGLKAFDGAFVASEVARVLAGTPATTEVSSPPAASPALNTNSQPVNDLSSRETEQEPT